MGKRCDNCAYYWSLEKVKTVSGPHYDEYDSYYLKNCSKRGKSTFETQDEALNCTCSDYED